MKALTLTLLMAIGLIISSCEEFIFIPCGTEGGYEMEDITTESGFICSTDAYAEGNPKRTDPDAENAPN